MSALPAGAISRITPTQMAEEAYHAAQQQRPRMRRPYRPCDKDLLARVAREVFDEYRASELPDEQRATAAAALADEAERLFDQGEMLVLKKWGCASERTSLAVALRFARAEQIALPRAVLAPSGGGFRCFDLAGVTGTPQPPVPAACVSFFSRAEVIAAERAPFLQSVAVWPIDFKRKQGRAPTWGEIAAAWPRLAKRISEL